MYINMIKHPLSFIDHSLIHKLTDRKAGRETDTKCHVPILLSFVNRQKDKRVTDVLIVVEITDSIEVL